MPASSWPDLALIRHGIAQPRDQGLDRPDRALTRRGRSRTLAVMQALVRRGLVLDRLIASPYRRAVETGQLALQAGVAPQLDFDDRLSPGGAPAQLLRSLQGTVGFVGHEPDLGDLACELLGLAPGGISLRKAGLVLLRRVEQRWQLEALLRPGLLLERSD